jgi:hypothetical protein
MLPRARISCQSVAACFQFSLLANRSPPDNAAGSLSRRPSSHEHAETCSVPIAACSRRGRPLPLWSWRPTAAPYHRHLDSLVGPVVVHFKTGPHFTPQGSLQYLMAPSRPTHRSTAGVGNERLALGMPPTHLDRLPPNSPPGVLPNRWTTRTTNRKISEVLGIRLPRRKLLSVKQVTADHKLSFVFINGSNLSGRDHSNRLADFVLPKSIGFCGERLDWCRGY